MRTGIAVLGTIAYDEIKIVSSYPSPSQLAKITEVHRSIGGAVCNCAVTLAKIDAMLPIEIVALVGADGRGQFIKEHLKRYKNVDLSQLNEGGETTFTDVIHDASNHSRTFFVFLGNAHLFNASHIDTNHISSKIVHVAYLLMLEQLDAPDEEYGTQMAKLLHELQQNGIETSIDIVSENSNRYQKIVPPALKYTDYCIINELEASQIVNIPLRNEDGMLIYKNVKPVLYKLKEMGVKKWVIIHAPEGSFGFDGQEVFKEPSLNIDTSQIKGTVGAGDAYAAGVLYGAEKEQSILTCMRLGTAAAASSLFGVDSTSTVLSYEQLQVLYEKNRQYKEISI